MNSFEKFFENKLPDWCEFYSSLKDGRINKRDRCISEKYGHISEEDYLHAANVWNEFKIKSLVDYYDLYFIDLMYLKSSLIGHQNIMD